MSSGYLHHRRPCLAAPRKVDPSSRRDLVTLLPVMSRVRSTFLLAPIAPPVLLLREIYTYIPVSYLLFSFSRSYLWFFLPPPTPFYPFTLSLFLSSRYLCRYSPYVMYITLFKLAALLLCWTWQHRSVRSRLFCMKLHLYLWTLRPEKICQFDRPIIFAPAHVLATFPLLFAVAVFFLLPLILI